MEAITPGNKIAIDFLRSTFVLESDFWILRFQIIDSNVVDFKQQRATVSKATLNQVFYNFLLPVNGDALVYQRFEINPVQISIDTNIDSPMRHAFLLKACANAHVAEQIRGPMLDQTSANTIFNVIATTVFDDD